MHAKVVLAAKVSTSMGAVIGGAEVSLMRVRDPLLHPVRKRIFDYIESHPGAFLGEMDRRLDYGRGTLQHHVRVLERASLVTEEVEGTRRHLFVKAAVPHRERPRLAALANPSARRVFDAIAQVPGIHQTPLAERLGVSRAALRKHLRRLESVGLIEARRQGRVVDYRVASDIDLGEDGSVRRVDQEVLGNPRWGEAAQMLEDLDLPDLGHRRSRITRVDGAEG